jgi:hypothetical protein
MTSSVDAIGLQPKVAFITAIYGGYEKTCKPFAAQTIPADFIAFTDDSTLPANGWQVDCEPYHVSHPSPLASPELYNAKNTHTFCVAKYYKQAFRNIPRLASYDAIVWIDGTVEITNERTAEIVLDLIRKGKEVITWFHSQRPKTKDALWAEVQASNFDRYNSPFWFGQHQPIQDCVKQFEVYMREGYDWSWFPDNISMWVTCFVAFDMRTPRCNALLDAWYLQTLEHTTQDQVSFPYVCWKTKVAPYTLPDADVTGDFYTNSLYKRRPHHV